MQIKSLGHVVIRVSDIKRSEAFYRDTLGLPVCAHFNEGGVNMAFFTLGNHHDFAIMESAELGESAASGLDHVAFKIGDEIEELIEAKNTLAQRGIATESVDHDITKSLYLADPDGNGVELYIDASDGWREDPQRIAAVAPLEI